MKMTRTFIAASLVLLLAACGDEHKDKAAAPTPPPAPATAPAAASAPAPKPAAEQPRESEAKPAAAKAVASPKAPAVEAAIKPEAKAPSKTPAQVKKPVDPVVKKALPPAKLDLRLPKDLVQKLEPDEPATQLDEEKPILPQMFGEKSGQSPFAVGGRLIQREVNERESNDDSWHSDIKGAEVQFEFRH